MSYKEFLSFEIDSENPHLGIVRLARPEKLNTISGPFYDAMIELQQTEIVRNTQLRAIAMLADGRIDKMERDTLQKMLKPLFAKFMELV